MRRTLSQQRSTQQRTDRYAAHSEKTELSIGQLKNLRKHPTPTGRGYKWVKALDHQNEGHRQPERVAIQVYFLEGAAAALPRNTLKNSEEAGSTTMTSLFLLKLTL